MIANSRLSPLQRRILVVLNGISPAWTLTGGAALAGFILGHRTTRDLDLFWHDTSELGLLPDEVERRLLVARLEVTRVVDLVADPTPCIEPPITADDGIPVDTRHEILVNKVCTLLSRSEIRDLEDVRALVEAGADLDRAIGDAPRKDGGFSPLMLAWTLGQSALVGAEDAGFDRARLVAFRNDLVRRLTAQ